MVLIFDQDINGLFIKLLAWSILVAVTFACILFFIIELVMYIRSKNL